MAPFENFDRDNEVNVNALVKGDERFIFIFDNNSTVAALGKFEEYANNPELNFTWNDATCLALCIRKMATSALFPYLQESTDNEDEPENRAIPVTDEEMELIETKLNEFLSKSDIQD